MMNEVMIGTLSTLTTFMTPLAGTLDPNRASYRLEAVVAPAEGQCSKRDQTDLVLRIEQSPSNYFTLNVQGRICTHAHGIEPVGFAVNLPADLMDDAFLKKLPTNTPYVVSALPSPQDPHIKSRLKITKLAASGELIPIEIEWLTDDNGKVLHAPMTIWLKKFLVGNIGFMWSKVAFTEFGTKLIEPIAIAGTTPTQTIK